MKVESQEMGKTGLAAAFLALSLVSGPAAAQQGPGRGDPANLLQGAALVKALRDGGLTLLFRHAVTDQKQHDQLPYDPKDCAKQRNLTEGGRAQARLVHEGLVALQVPIGEVLASPICRTMETGRLASGREPTPFEGAIGFDVAVAGAGAKADQSPLRELVRVSPGAGTNRLIAGHNSTFETVVGPPTLEEGEGAVLRAVEGKVVLLARLKPADWKQLAATGERSAAPDPGFALEGAALAAALREGAHTLYFRHAATDMTQQDRPGFDPADCRSQRNLSDAGRQQARRIGAELARLKLPLGEVVASPFCRTVETARLVSGKEPALVEAVRGMPVPGAAPDYAPLATLLGRRVNKGVPLRVIVGHANGFRALVGVPVLEEGEAAVLRPAIGGWAVVARLKPTDWDRLP
jgi:broad specificity phosphatase PhoE